MIQVFDHLEALSRAAAGRFAEEARRAVAAHGRFVVALAGGSTPRRTYELLALPPFRDTVPWSEIHVFWGDERCVPPDDSRSNFNMARKALLDHVPLPASQVHPIECAGDPDPVAAAIRYEETLKDFFRGSAPRFDFVFLGLGEDAHTASLFPGTDGLLEQDRWTAGVRPRGEALTRVTLTASLLNRAAFVCFLVSGASKAQALYDVLEGSLDPVRLPAQRIHPVDGEWVWMIDRDAAALLPSGARAGG